MKEQENASDLQSPNDDGQKPGPKRKGERLISLLIVGTILLNFPLLSIFSSKSLLWGFPVLFLYLFIIWGLIIGALVLVLRNGAQRSSGPVDTRKNKDR
jgi:hypothetical protein